MANRLYFGDNLGWLRNRDEFPNDSVDLVYLDPPFNSNADYYNASPARTRLEKEVSEHHLARERSETNEELAERIVRSGMKELGWSEKELGQRRKGDPAKVHMARELRERTSIDLKWIARRLNMGSWSHVFKLVTKSKSAKNED